jgi:ATP synthase protein I
MLRGAVLPSLVALPVITGIGWVWRGRQGTLSALVGALVALVIFEVGLIAIKAVVDGPPALSMAGALVVYFGQLIAVLFVIVLLRDASWLDGRAFAAAVLAEGLVWQIGQVTGFLRGRHQIYDGPSVENPQAGG